MVEALEILDKYKMIYILKTPAIAILARLCARIPADANVAKLHAYLSSPAAEWKAPNYSRKYAEEKELFEFEEKNKLAEMQQDEDAETDAKLLQRMQDDTAHQAFEKIMTGMWRDDALNMMESARHLASQRLHAEEEREEALAQLRQSE